MSTRPGVGHDPNDPVLSTLMKERGRLINLAYRLLGSLAEAEDAVQETYIRWYRLSREEQGTIESPAAWLTTVASRICLNVLTSARARRETYIGEWLPEPLPDPVEWSGSRQGKGADAVDPADRITLDESVSMAYLVMLESMTPAERVALILHDVFGYPFSEVGAITGRTPAACRQLASSARRRVRVAQPRATPAQVSLVRGFKRAFETGDIDAIIGVLDPGATLTGDGGSSLQPIEGAEQVAHFLAAIASDAPRDVRLVERRVNGQPGLVAQQGDRTLAVYAFEIAGDQIIRIWTVLNPDKLRPWATGVR